VLGDKAGRQTAKMLGIGAIFVLRDGSVSSTL